MFDTSDPRATLMNNVAKNAEHTEFSNAEYGKFYEMEPVKTDIDSKNWWMRGQNFFIAYADAASGSEFKRGQQVDEYVLILPDKESQAVVTWGNQEAIVDGFSLVIIPPGESEIELVKGGKVIRLFSSANTDLEEFPINKASYREPHPNVSLIEPWPEPKEGYKVRAYSLDVPKEEGRFGRIFRCSTFMVNFLDPNDGPRDPSKMSPHSHDDFEQCSLAIEGEFVHHLRWPWTTDMAQWRPDDHEHFASPSVAVIPPGVIHTTQAIGLGINQLVDIFCPPRVDFSEKNGWVLNADEYPMP
ncbi:hypothetical protein J2Y03_002355 [Neobacillus niacini]|uniref:hypothetical protein n=1 Tax=Neobacillus niacini TaxID=86668 RepID=UPI0028662A37|nr:hypothetical protein [Neobacillus niacini]MDR7077331.1 hypothetical protein [Neobacillus niacini]